MKKSLFKSYTAKKVVRLVVIYLIIILIWIRFFNVTAPATTNNTYVDTIEVVRIEKFGYPLFYRNILIIYTDDGKYIMDLGGSRTDTIENVLLTKNNPVEVTIHEHLRQYPYVYYSLWVKQIVNIQDGNNTVWSIEKHNALQRTQRILGLIGFSFSTIFIVLLSLPMAKVTIFDAIKRKYRRYKKKQKKLRRRLNDSNK